MIIGLESGRAVRCWPWRPAARQRGLLIGQLLTAAAELADDGEGSGAFALGDVRKAVRRIRVSGRLR